MQPTTEVIAIPDPELTLYVLLAGILGGLLLALVVMVCCRICLPKKKPLTRQHVVFSRSSDRDHHRSGSRNRKYHSLDSSASVDIESSWAQFSDSTPSPREAKEFPPEQQTVVQRQEQQRNEPSSPRHMSPRSLADIPETKTPEDEPGDPAEAQKKSVPEGRRRSSAGIQRQASVCVSDGEEEDSPSPPTAADVPHISTSAPPHQSTTQTQQRHHQKRHRHRGPDDEDKIPQTLNITKVSADVHRCGTEATQHQLSCPALLVCNTGASSSEHRTGTRVLFDNGRRSQDPSTDAAVSSASSRRFKGPEVRPVTHRRSYHLQSTTDLEEHSQARRLNRHSTGSLPLLRERSVTSLDGEGWTEIPTPLREAASTEVGLLEKGLDAHLQKRLGLRPTNEEEDDDTDTVKRPVRYNDTGSREEIREDISSSPEEEMDEEIQEEEEEELDEDDSTEEYEQARLEYRLLWQLRTTFEEEEEVSDTLRLEDEEDEEEEEDEEREDTEELEEQDKEVKVEVTPDKEEDPTKEMEEAMKADTAKDTSPDKEASSSHTASFESSTAPTDDPPSAITEQVFSHLLSLPTADSRRSSYVSRASKRLKRSIPGSTEGQNSFDSSASAEWSSTDASRASTSFESSTTTTTTTTDNTDSTAESQTRKLQQMKADSGYKSMESTEHPPPGYMTVRLKGQRGLEGDSIEEADEALFTCKEEETTELQNVPSARTQEKKEELDKKPKSPVLITIIDETLESRTKRSFPRQVRSTVITELDPIASIESSTGANIPQEVLGKMSVFQRFFRSSRPPRIERLIRDYSIDEKTDCLFREFSRPDPGLEADAQRAWSAAWRQSHFRLHHQAHHPHHHLHRRIDQDDDVPLASAKVLSPQVSIEEESDAEARLASSKVKKVDTRMQESDWGRTTGLILQEIPAIRLPEEDLL